MKRDFCFVKGYEHLEQRLEEWGTWRVSTSEQVGWYIGERKEGVAARGNTAYSNRVLWEVVNIMDSDHESGKARDMETDSAIRRPEMPTLWRGLLWAGFVKNWGVMKISEELGIDRRGIPHHFEAIYGELEQRLEGLRRSRTRAA